MHEFSQNRRSKQRNKILCVLRSTHIHPTAEWIFEKVRRDIPRISLGTIYRNLRLLSEQDIIREVHIRDSQARYDSRVEEHQHFICSRCHSINDIEPVTERQRYISIERKYKCRVFFHQLDFYGLCHKCMKERPAQRFRGIFKENARKREANCLE